MQVAADRATDACSVGSSLSLVSSECLSAFHLHYSLAAYQTKHPVNYYFSFGLSERLCTFAYANAGHVGWSWLVVGSPNHHLLHLHRDLEEGLPNLLKWFFEKRVRVVAANTTTTAATTGFCSINTPPHTYSHPPCVLHLDA